MMENSINNLYTNVLAYLTNGKSIIFQEDLCVELDAKNEHHQDYIRLMDWAEQSSGEMIESSFSGQDVFGNRKETTEKGILIPQYDAKILIHHRLGQRVIYDNRASALIRKNNQLYELIGVVTEVVNINNNSCWLKTPTQNEKDLWLSAAPFVYLINDLWSSILKFQFRNYYEGSGRNMVLSKHYPQAENLISPIRA
jgi:hypothetical protein